MSKKTLENTNRQIIQGFRDLVADKGFISDDNGWSQRLVFFYLLKYRAKILSEKMEDRKSRVSLFNRQTISCIPLEEIDLVECPCAPASGCSFLRTKYPIPEVLSQSFIVSSIEGSINYSFVEWERFKYKLKSRISADKTRPYFTIRKIGEDYHIYVYNDVHKKFITVTAVFESPLEVQVYPSCDGVVDHCFKPLDQKFILDEDLIPIMYDMAITSLVRANRSAGTDILNNDTDDLAGVQVPLK